MCRSQAQGGRRCPGHSTATTTSDPSTPTTQTEPPKLTADLLHKELELINKSGDRLYNPGSLKVRPFSSGAFHITYDAVEDSEEYQIHVDEETRTFIGFKAYTEEEADLQLTDARPVIVSELPDFTDQMSETTYMDSVSDKIAETMENLQEERDWNLDEDAAKFMYFGEAHGDINMALRDGTQLNPNLVSTLDRIMTSHTVEEDTLVYRGIRASHHPELQQRMEEGTYSDPGFMSTTTAASTARNFSGGGKEGSIVMVLKLPKGTKCFISEGSENEITLPRNTDLRLASYVFY